MTAGRIGILLVALATALGCGARGPRSAAAPPAERPRLARRAVEIAAGRFHTCARADDRTVWCWGNGGAGQLGRPAGQDALTPVLVADLTDAVALRAAGFGTCVLRRAGVDACFGLGTAEVAAAPAAGPDARGLDHLCLVANGRVSCRGDASFGQLGDDSDGHDEVREIAGIDDAVAIAAGLVHTCALRAGGDVSCWGGNEFGQLGDGTRTRRARPVTIRLPDR